MKWNSVVLSFALVMCLIAATPSRVQAQSTAQNTAARALFLEGRDFWDEGKYADAEKKFREALTKYPKADQSDRTTYYLITTLIKLGRTADARTEIENFNRNYPQSTWKSDVEEKRIALSGTPFIVGPNAVHVTAPGAYFEGVANLPQRVNETKQRYAVSMNLARNALARGVSAPFSILVGNASLESEIFRLILEKDPDRGIEVAKERLKTDPSDPAVISNLGAIANSSSSQALPFLVTLAGSSAIPNTRSQAIFWMGRSNGDKDGVAKALMEMLANSKDKETDAAVAEAIAGFNTVERRATIDKFVEFKTPERLAMLEKIYRSTTNALLRTQISQAAAQIPDAKALTFLADVARNDKDITVRRSAIQALAGRKDADTVKTLEDLLKTLPPEAPKK